MLSEAKIETRSEATRQNKQDIWTQSFAFRSLLRFALPFLEKFKFVLIKKVFNNSRVFPNYVKLASRKHQSPRLVSSKLKGQNSAPPPIRGDAEGAIPLIRVSIYLTKAYSGQMIRRRKNSTALAPQCPQTGAVHAMASFSLCWIFLKDDIFW